MAISGLLAAAGIPLDYGDAADEARTCRSTCALFDFSFISSARLRGPGALSAIQTLTRRSLDDLPPGRIRYALCSDRNGHVVADLTVWRIDAQVYDVFSGRRAEVEHLLAQRSASLEVVDRSTEIALLAVQGPHSLRALALIADVGVLAALPYFSHAEVAVGGVPMLVGRLGYTGERGFEIIVPRTHRHAAWRALAECSRPAGFAAADILRIEAGFLLFTNELSIPVTACELGMVRFGGAIGASPRVRLVSFRAGTSNFPVVPAPSPKSGFPPRRGEIFVSSACFSPLARSVLGLGYVCADEAAAGGFTDPSGRYDQIEMVSRPYYDPEKAVPRGSWRCGEWLPS